ncbi:NAD(P)/FAD-dependent oxidoreductase [uncultured Clostridium sp.]|uniref:NAD(P)/FAD-dependent oxidoreductase n=1 Tax=uncultured Clostridium sp. TaxID=59620 RepID=UPI0026231D1B|nr:NAD(P)/FAD-dependent oxidoreductase [uncultured Clostridium sp.]
MSKVIVVGAGPAGIMAAIKASEENEVILIERNDEIGKKLKLTGGGRCNITNNREIEDMLEKVVTNKKFLYSSFYTFTNRDVLKYFSERGLEYKVEYDEKIYPQNDTSEDIINIFKRDLKEHNIKVLYNSTVTDFIIEEETIKGVIINDSKEVYADKVIVSTGGKSFPQTGSDGLTFSLLEKYNHSVTPLYAALIPLVVKENFVKNMQGISMKDVSIKAKVKNKTFMQQGDMIFTHFGISGPGVLKISSYITKVLEKNDVVLTLDFLSSMTKEELSKKIRENVNKTIFNNIKGILPQKFLKEILELCNLEDVKAADLKKQDELKFINLIKEMNLTIGETLTIKAAMVTSGGVSVKEINSSTLESKKIKNLYFCGEVIDIDAETGGYNLQIAFSTGTLAGMLT